MNVVSREPYRLALDVRGVGFKTADRIAATIGVAPDSPQRMQAGVLQVAARPDGGRARLDGQRDASSPRARRGCSALDGRRRGRARAHRARARGLRAHGPRRRRAGRRASAPSTSPRCTPPRCASRERLARARAAPPARALDGVDDGHRALRDAGAASSSRPSSGAPSRRRRARRCSSSPADRASARRRSSAPSSPCSRAPGSTCASPRRRAAPPSGMSEATGARGDDAAPPARVRPEDGGLQARPQPPHRGRRHRRRRGVDARPRPWPTRSPRPSRRARASSSSATSTSSRASARAPSCATSSPRARSRACACAQIFRQAARSLIVTNAHRINDGRAAASRPAPRPRDADFFVVERRDPERGASHHPRARDLAHSRPLRPRSRPRRPGPHPDEPRPGRAPSPSTRRCRRRSTPAGAALVRGARTYRVGDKVMQLRNDYDKNVCNGDVGFVASIDPEETRDDRPLRRAGRRLRRRPTSTSSSSPTPARVHKSQGSEYPAVVIPLLTTHFVMLSQEPPLHGRHARQAPRRARGRPARARARAVRRPPARTDAPDAGLAGRGSRAERLAAHRRTVGRR